MMKERIEVILKRKGLTKTAFAEALGVKKQNINKLMGTRNIANLQKMARVLQVGIDDLYDKPNKKAETLHIIGFVEVEEDIYKIESVEELQSLVRDLKAKSPKSKRV